MPFLLVFQTCPATSLNPECLKKYSLLPECFFMCSKPLLIYSVNLDCKDCYSEKPVCYHCTYHFVLQSTVWGQLCVPFTEAEYHGIKKAVTLTVAFGLHKHFYVYFCIPTTHRASGAGPTNWAPTNTVNIDNMTIEADLCPLHIFIYLQQNIK